MSASASELSRHLDCSREEIRRLVEKRVLVHTADGRFDIDNSRRRYINHLRAKPTQASGLIDARTRLLDLRAAKLRGEMAPVAALDAFYIENIGELFLMLYAAMAAKSRDRRERAYWKNVIDDTRNAWADKMAARADALEKAKDDAA